MTTAAPSPQKLLTRSFVIVTLENFLVAMNYYLLIIVVSKFATDEFGVSTALAGFSASIFVIGGLASGVVAQQFGVSPFLSIWLAPIAATLAALLIGLPSLRLRGLSTLITGSPTNRRGLFGTPVPPLRR